jgi:sulfopyruvate decarboxylase TPP-binding subunit
MTPSTPPTWQEAVFQVLKRGQVRQVAYVPDAGHAHLIRRAIADPEISDVALTTEEEGVALVSGAWLGGQRAVLLMQSSGVGNCVNMFSLLRSADFPFFTLVTMRGEFGEFNPWQTPMSQATQAAMELMGIQVLRASGSSAARSGSARNEPRPLGHALPTPRFRFAVAVRHT